MIFTGVLDDPRNEEEKALDYQFDEIASSGTVQWNELKVESRYPIRNQAQSASCVAQSLALILGIENLREEGRFIEFSASDIYQRRTNNGGGMHVNEALQIATKSGATLEVLMPSQNMGEQAINAVRRVPSDEEIGKIFRGNNYVHVPFNIDRIALAMEQNKINGIVKPIMVWFRFYRDEWTGVPQILRPLSGGDIVHHSVVAIAYGMYNGKKALLIQDSWGHDSTTIRGLRVITEDFIPRMTVASFVTDLSNTKRAVEAPTTPKIDLTGVSIPLSRESTILVQNALKSLNFFPKNQTSTGVYGNITRASVRRFQQAHGLTVDGIVGRITLSKLQEEINKL